MNDNVAVAFMNRVDGATFDPTVGAWLTELPLSNLRDKRYAVVTRSADASTASTQLVFDMGAPYPIRLLAPIAHNLSTAGLWKATGSMVSNFATTEFTTGWVEAYPPMPFGSLDWNDESFWSGVMGPERRSYYPPHTYQLLDTTQLCRYIKLEIDDTTNAAGCVELGRFFAGPVFQPVHDLAWGVSIGHDTKTTVDESPGGTESFDDRPLRRVVRMSLGWLSQAEAFGPAFDLDRQLSISGEAFLVLFPGVEGIQIQTAFPARMRQLTPAEHPDYGIWKKSYEFIERIA